MATPSPQPPPHLAHIKTAARKLPVKRRTPDSSTPAANPGSSAAVKLEIIPYDLTAAINGGDAAGDDDVVDDDDEAVGDDADDAGGGVRGAGGSAGAIPFKFQRIWSEPDEIRFLQGLLACHPQGMTFPRDLNLYFDRFSEAMSQPYTRSQLSEKLRRLRKKFRAHAARVARGLDPSTLPLHDRDLFHLSTLLWDPAFAASSPFGSSSNGSVPGNKRRRHIPVPGVRSGNLSSPTQPTLAAPSPPASPLPLLLPAPADVIWDQDGGGCNGSQEEQPPLQQRKLPIGSGNDGLGHLAAKTALDVFDSCLKDLRANLVRRGMLHSTETVRSGGEHDLLKRWQEQRAAELDVLARRLRLALEQAVED